MTAKDKGSIECYVTDCSCYDFLAAQAERERVQGEDGCHVQLLQQERPWRPGQKAAGES